MKQPHFIGPALLLLMATLALPEAAQAATETWSGVTNEAWNTSGNWTGTNLPPISGDSLVFTSATGAGGLNLNNDLTNSSFTLGGTTAITFNAGAGAYVIGNGTTTANMGNTFILGGNVLNSSTNLQTINNPFSMTAARTFTTSAGGGDIMLTGLISGASGAITKAGSGTLILTNTANSFTGVVSVSAGTVRASDSTVYGAGDQNITTTVLGQAASNGASFASNSTAKTLDLRYNGQNDATIQKLQLLNSKGGNLLVNSSSTNSTVNVDRESGTGTNKTIAFFNSTMANGAVLTVTGANGYSLGLGTLSAGTGAATGSVTISPTTANVTIGNINNAGTTGFAHTLILDGTSSGSTITGIIANSTTGGGVISVTKQNSSTWTLSGASTYTGATTVNGGTLALGAANRIADTSNLVMAGGAFATGGFNETLGTLTLSASSTIDLGSGASALVFADSSGTTWGTSISLSFVNFTAGVDTVRIGTTSGGLTGTQLALITINGSTASLDSSGFLSIAAIPEPSTWGVLIGAAALAGTLLMRRYRRSA